MVGAIYSLIALGYTMVYGVLRLINFAHGEVFMLGAYAALFTSWAFGFTPEAVRGGQAPSASWLALVAMLLVSMVACGLVSVVIERFAYRPMRQYSRVASLITAIGVSLLLQYGGALLLPTTQQSIQQEVSPVKGQLVMNLKSPSSDLLAKLETAEKEYESANSAYERLRDESDKFNPPPAVEEARLHSQEVESAAREYRNAVNKQTVSVTIPYGYLVVLVTTVVLMLVLRFLVMNTRPGRAMRAVSHDFDAAALMGINVSRIIAFTFILGSALAGAGAMMNATFFGTSITPFYGVQPGVKAFVAAVLGGIGNIPGAVLGGILMGVAETLVTWTGQSGYKDAVAFVILILLLLFKPGGLLGSAKVEKV